jgi:pyruvate,water dikinase
VLLFKPDAELRRLARLAIESGVAGAFADGRTPAEVDAELAGSDEGRRWLDELEKVKDPWFNMGTGDGLYHYYRSWYDDPSIPYASIAGHISALAEGREIERPTEELARERDRLAEGYAELLGEEQRGAFLELLGLSRTVFPYVEEHKFFCDYWFLTRWYNKLREFGALLARNGYLEDSEDVFHLSRHEVAQALEELVLHWASGGLPMGPHHWPPMVARRKELLAKLADWTPPPALGTMPEAANDPITVMLWGITPARLQEWARAQDGDGTELRGSPASPGTVEGLARVVRTVDEIGTVRDGEILVCGSTSPAWAPIFSRISATVTDIGGVMSHTAIVAREYGLPAVVGTGRATAQIRTGQRVRVDGTAGTVTVLDDDQAS